MRIAMIGQKGIAVTHDGGIERHVEEISTRLVKFGHEVFVYCRKHYMPEELRENRKLKGVNLIMQPSINTKYLDTITHVFVSTCHALGQKYDVIHYHGVGPSTLAFIPRIIARGTKTIVTFHSIDRFHLKWGPFARKFLEFGEWTACRYPHKTITVSKTLQRYCWKRYKKNTVYIPNGVSVSENFGTDKIRKFGLIPDQYILSVARFVKHKGLHWLISAYKNIKTNKKLVLVGESPYPNKYADYLRKLASRQPNIIFTGYQTGDVLDQLFTNAYLYVHPSESEGLSITILEAMAYGKCVLISDIEENLEAMSQYGFYFKTGNVEDLRRKLERLLLDSKIVKDLGCKAKKFVKEEHNWDEITKKTEEVYRN